MDGLLTCPRNETEGFYDTNMIFPALNIVATVGIANLAIAGVFQLPIARTTIGWDIKFLDGKRHADVRWTTPRGIVSNVLL